MNLKKIVLIGFGIYYIDINDNIKHINFDLISSDVNQDAHAVIRGLRLLRQQQFFKEIDMKEYIIWCDAGKHFRNNEILGYFLRELTQENINGIKGLFIKFTVEECKNIRFPTVPNNT